MTRRQSTASASQAPVMDIDSGSLKDQDTFCLCKGQDDGRPMINCENCNDWFHFECIGLDESTAAELETYICANCTESTGKTSTYSWEATDDELTFVPRGPPERPPSPIQQVLDPPLKQQRRDSVLLQAKSETPKPSVVVPAPTFAPPESDSDFDIKDDDEEYTEERRRARKKNARRIADSDSDGSEHGAVRPRTTSGVKRKANALGGGTAAAAKRKRLTHNPSSSQQLVSDPLSDPVRKYCYGKLEEVILPIFVEYRAVEDDEEVTEDRAKDLGGIYTKSLEAAVFEACAEIDKVGKRAAGASYKDRFRQLTFNISQHDRTEVRSRIGRLSLPAHQLAVMPSSELANDAFKQEMEKIAQEQLAQTVLKSVDASRPRAKITHKGEEIIDSYVYGPSYGPEASGALEVDDKMEQRRPLKLDTNLREDAAGVPGSAIEQTPASAAMVVMETPISAAAESATGEPASAIAEASALSPIVTKVSANEDALTGGVGDVQSPTVPTSATLSARRAFDLSSLWSGGENIQPPFTSSDKEPTRNEDEDEVAMDLDLGAEEPVPGINEDDFAMFLEGVDGGKPEADSTKAPSAPAGVPQQSTSDMEKFEKLPVVWSGDLTLPLDPNPAISVAVKVRQVAGRDLGTSASLWKPLLAHSKKNCIWIEGRVPTDRSTKYLVTTRMNAGKELVAVMLVPDENNESAKGRFTELVDTLIKKDRHGLVFPWGPQPSSSAPGKDMYLIPLKPKSPLPEFIELLDRASSIPKKREQDVILGVYVLNKGKLVVPTPTPPIPAATPMPAPLAPAAPPPAVANLLQTQGGISSLLSSVLGTLPPAQPNPSQPPVPALPLGLSSYANPPQPVQPPPTATLAALSNDLKNLTPEQVSRILQGLASNPGVPSFPPPPSSQHQPWPTASYPNATPPAPQSYPPPPSGYPSHPPPAVRSPLQHNHPDRVSRIHNDRDPRLGPYPSASPRRDSGPPPRDRRGPRGGRDRDRDRERDDGWRRERDSGWASRRGAAAGSAGR